MKKKAKVTCSICPLVLQGIKKYFVDMKKIFTKDFIKENYYKHFGYSALFTVLTVLLLLKYCYLDATPYLFQVFVGGFGAWWVNFFREHRYADKNKAPFDYTDINMGSYGGIIGAIIAILIFNLF